MRETIEVLCRVPPSPRCPEPVIHTDDDCTTWLPRLDLNGARIQVFDRPPTALEFSRLVHISRPVVFRSAFSSTILATCSAFLISSLHCIDCFDSHNLPALSRWTDAYLAQKMTDRPVTVAVTPDGSVLMRCQYSIPPLLTTPHSLADAVKQSADGMAYFTEPCSEKMTMAELLHVLREPPREHRSVK